MPIPEPQKNETEKDFISRCMGNETMNKDYPDNDQRAAVCHSQWRKEHPESKKPAKSEDEKNVEVKAEAREQKAPESKQKTKPTRQVMIPAEREEKPSPMTKMRAAPIVEGKVGQLDPGWIEGYAAVFNNIDTVGDRILPGAFTKTIKERMLAGKVKLMAVHLRDGGGAREVIGTVTQAKEDDIGLWQHSVLSRTRTAQEIRQNVLDGHIGGLSLGYVAKDADFEDVAGKTVRDLKEVAWWETTVTTIPVNELALITAAKAEAAAELQPANVDDSTRAKLEANRDAVQAKATEMNNLIAERMELLDPEAKAEDTDTDAENAAQDTAVSPLAEEIERKKLELEDIMAEK